MQSGPTVDAGINDDSHTTISSLRTMVEDFVSQRDWKQFHSPKNLSMALAIEASELMEHFQWISMEESREPDAARLVEIGEELADVFCYALGFANALNIDISTAVQNKMIKNRQKYPESIYKGFFGRDDRNFKSATSNPEENNDLEKVTAE